MATSKFWTELDTAIGQALVFFLTSYKAEILYPTPLNGTESKYSVENAEKNLPVCENVQ